MKQVVIFNYWLESGKGNSVSVPEASNFIEKGTLAQVFSCELYETSSGGCFCEKHFGEINDLKNQGQEILLENDEVIFEEVEELGNKYRDFVARYDIPIDEIESNLRSRNRKTMRQSKKKEEWSGWWWRGSCKWRRQEKIWPWKQILIFES